MKILLLFISLLLSMFIHANPDKCDQLYGQAKSLIEKSQRPLGALPFYKMKLKHYKAYINKEMELANINLDKIINSKATPTYNNTIEPLLNLTKKSGIISSYLKHLNYMNNTAPKSKYIIEIGKKGNNLSSKINFSETLFKKIQMIAESSDFHNLSKLEKSIAKDYKESFKANGFELPEAQRNRLVEIKNKGQELGQLFVKNIEMSKKLNFAHFKNVDELDGLSESMLKACKENAKKRDLEGYVVEGTGYSASEYLSYASKSSSRKRIYKVVTNVANSGQFNNENTVKELLELRHEYANILGHKDFATYALKDNMAKNQKNVLANIDAIIKRTEIKAQNDKDAYLNYISENLGINKDSVSAWDHTFYSRLYKENKMSLSDEMTKPYFELESTLDGVFRLVKKLYNVEFRQVKLPKYHRDIKTYMVLDKATNKELGLFYLDLFSNPQKRGGAYSWSVRPQGELEGKNIRPHVVNVLNITKPLKGEPTLLKLSEVETILHELGHGLHSLLSDVKYMSLSGTAVESDFVEAPSTFMEFFLREKWFLDSFAKHYKTGEPMSAELATKIAKSLNFGSASAKLGQARYAYLDQVYHTESFRDITSFKDFENKLFNRTDKQIAENNSFITYRFSHLFSNFISGYTAGYYVYQWAENYAANTFMTFKKESFSKEVAQRWREYVLSAGGTDDSIENYLRFAQGVEADPQAFFIINGIE